MLFEEKKSVIRSSREPKCEFICKLIYENSDSSLFAYGFDVFIHCALPEINVHLSFNNKSLKFSFIESSKFTEIFAIPIENKLLNFKSNCSISQLFIDHRSLLFCSNHHGTNYNRIMSETHPVHWNKSIKVIFLVESQIVAFKIWTDTSFISIYPSS